MVSESARMSSAEEARFRIDTPNSRPRAVKVIALDRKSEGAVDELAQIGWNSTTFFVASNLTANPAHLSEEIGSADLVVMVATAGEPAHDVAAIGEACSRHRVTTTGLILGADTSDEALSKTLAQLRPWMLMLVVADTEEYVADMLKALRG